MRSLKKLEKGFTLIEMMVSLAVFSVVVTISVGALLVLIASNEQLQAEQGVMTNLSFALDSMTREMRTGTHYFCAGQPNYSAGGPEAIFDVSDSQEALGTSVNDCYDGKGGGERLHGVSFIEGGDSITAGIGTRILYYYDDLPLISGVSNPNYGKIMRRVGDNAAQPIISSGIHISNAEFFVSGPTLLSTGGVNSKDQASITIFIEAQEVDDPTAKTYEIQTTVTQRTLDI